MLMPAILLVAVLGPSAQDAPAPAPSPKAHRKVAKPAAHKAAAPAANPDEPPAAAPSTAPAAAPAASGASAADDIQAGLNAFAKGRFATARAAFERAVAADPQSAAAHFYLGYTIYKIAEPKRHDSPGKKEAAAEFAKAYELDPNFKPVWGSHKG
jgi:tetratricopeptide (TPR) repeat protein